MDGKLYLICCRSICSVFFLYIFVFCDGCNAQDLSQSPYFDQAKIIGDWLLRSTAHRPLHGPTPFLKRQDNHHPILDPKRITQFNDEMRVSFAKVYLTNKLRGAYDYFNVGAQNIPDSLNLIRFNYTKDLFDRYDMGLSYLFVPDIKIKGFGGHFTYRILKYDSFFTALRIHLGRSWKEQNFDCISYGLSFIQSYNAPWFDDYVGAKYLRGKTIFDATLRGTPLPAIHYSTVLNKVELYGGLTRQIYKVLRAGLFFNIYENEKTYFAQLSFRIPRIKRKLGESRLPTLY